MFRGARIKDARLLRILNRSNRWYKAARTIKDKRSDLPLIVNQFGRSGVQIP